MTNKEFEVQLALGTLSFDVLRKLTYSKRASKKILTILSTNKSNHIREYVALNPNTPIEILEKLSIDKDNYVRYSVVYNHNTPIEMLEKLSTDDEDKFVKTAALWRVCKMGVK